MALQLLSQKSMRSACCMAVIIAGVVLFLRGDTTAVSAAGTHVDRPGILDGILDSRDVRRDVYGNDIAPAVADYLVDPYGEMYESHAPDTALLKLGQPGT